jgi:CRISPR/Cas system-associated endonuclease Cas1
MYLYNIERENNKKKKHIAKKIIYGKILTALN